MRVVVFFFAICAFCLFQPQPVFSDDQEQNQVKDPPEAFKGANQELYQKIQRSQEIKKSIDEIVSLYEQEKISEDETREKLYPLAQRRLELRYININQRIELLRRQLDAMEEFKNNPPPAINKEIDKILAGESCSACAHKRQQPKH